MDAPIRLLERGGVCCESPSSYSPSDGAKLNVKFSLDNFLSTVKRATTRLDGYSCALTVAGERFTPVIVTSKQSSDKSGEKNRRYFLGGIQYDISRLVTPVSTFVFSGQGGSATVIGCDYVIEVPEVAEPGSRMIMRSELFCDGNTMIQYSAPTTVRIASALPPTNCIVKCTDILVFSHVSMIPADYKALEDLGKILKLRIAYMDYKHFAGFSGSLSAQFWATQFGNATVVWAPDLPNEESIVSVDLLLEHVTKGGGLVCAGASTLQPSSSLLRDKVISNEARRIVRAAGHTHITAVKADATFTKELISGSDAIKIMMCIFSSFSFKQKVAYLVQCCLDNTADIPTGLPPIPNFQTVIVPAGCCSKASAKVMPATLSPCTIRDCILYLLRQDLLLDISGFQASQDFSKCYAINDLIECVDIYVVKKSIEDYSKVRAISYDFTAVALSAGLPRPKKYKSKVLKQWMIPGRSDEVSRVMAITREIAMESNLDCESWAQRIVMNEFKDPFLCSF